MKEVVTMASKKRTMTEQYEATKALLNGETVENYSIADAIKFIDGRIAQVEKKNSTPTGERKPTKTQLENEGIKQTILNTLAIVTSAVTVAEMQKLSVELSNLSNQKITSLLTQLRTAKKVVRTEEKGVARYGLPSAEE